jgi:hypothetical protein
MIAVVTVVVVAAAAEEEIEVATAVEEEIEVVISLKDLLPLNGTGSNDVEKKDSAVVEMINVIIEQNLEMLMLLFKTIQGIRLM